MSEKDSEDKKSIISSSFLKGLLTGVIISHINKAMVLGAMVGTAAGIYYEQHYPNDAPNVGDTCKKIYHKLRGDES